MTVPIILIITSYLRGGIPTSYLVARYKSGIDLRQYGSGNIGSTNLMEHSGKLTGLLVGVFDSLGKGTLAVVIARTLDQNLAVQGAAGLAAIAGHNWSPYLRFTGGRGVATAIGVSLGFMLWWEAVIVAVFMGVLGRIIFHETGFWTFISLITIPFLTIAFNRPPEVVWTTVIYGTLLLTKRLTANWEPPSKAYPLAKVLLYRLIWDRDVPTKQEWTKRRPVQ
jgi:glycerol-3-phosphate acyltransferase PlsY